MELEEIAGGLAAFRDRAPGSDAERRAALWSAERLRESGRAVAVETCWVRPRWQLAHALHAALGVAASVVAVGAPAVGLGLAAVALLSLLLDLGGRLFLLRRLTPERATQNVLSPSPVAADRPLRLILTAHCDAPRGGLLGRLAGGGRGAGGRAPDADGRRGPGAGGRGAGGRGGGPRLPGPYAWVALALLAVAACAALRFADAGGSALGAVQLVPTLVLLLALGLLVDAALARHAPADADATAVVLGAARVLDAVPPRRLAVDVVLAGAGEGQALGFLAFLRRHRPAPERAIVVEVAARAAADRPTWWTSDGALLPLRYHPRLVELATHAAAEERQLGAVPRRGRSVGAALRARQRRIPAIRLAAPSPADALALTLALVEAVDDDRG